MVLFSYVRRIRTMKTLLFFILGLACFYEGTDEAIEGIWLTQKKDSKIEITSSPDGTFSAQLVWAEAPYSNLVGKQVMKGVVYDNASGKFNCPWIYDPKLDITAKGTARVSGDTLYITARKGIFTKNEFFTREQPASFEKRQ